MEQFSTEEQQVEAIKRFWKENGTSIILGAVLGLGGLWGWRYYNESQIAAQEQASAGYQQVVTALQEQQAAAPVQQFVGNNSDNSYGVLAALQLAKDAVDNDNLEEAAKQLNWVISHSKENTVIAVAYLRLARVQLAQDNAEQALTSLDMIKDEAFAAQVAEVQGDIYQQQGAIDKARAAYSKALESDDTNRLLKMKLDNLVAASAEV